MKAVKRNLYLTGPVSYKARRYAVILARNNDVMETGFRVPRPHKKKKKELCATCKKGFLKLYLCKSCKQKSCIFDFITSFVSEGKEIKLHCKRCVPNAA